MNPYEPPQTEPPGSPPIGMGELLVFAIGTFAGANLANLDGADSRTSGFIGVGVWLALAAIVRVSRL